jgi:hypothetical protein
MQVVSVRRHEIGRVGDALAGDGARGNGALHASVSTAGAFERTLTR